MHFSLSTSPKHKKEYSSDSSEKKNNLLHFGRITVLIELILAGKAKLSMASCYIYSQISVISNAYSKYDISKSIF